MLSRTFKLPPVGIIEKSKHRLSNPKLFLPVFTGNHSGYTVRLSIKIPQGYAFSDDVITYDDYIQLVKYGRLKYRLKEEIFEVSQLDSKDAKLSGGKAGISAGWSKGQVVTASFLNEKDVKILLNLTSLTSKDLTKSELQTVSRLASVLKRSAFITDDDGDFMYFKDYYRGTLPMFSITSIAMADTFTFNHLKPIIL